MKIITEDGHILNIPANPEWDDEEAEMFDNLDDEIDEERINWTQESF